jgi:uncharacterized protein (DUF924 family)
MWNHCWTLLTAAAFRSSPAVDGKPRESEAYGCRDARDAHTAVISSDAAVAVVAFWKHAGPKLWFAKDADFDRRFRERFLALHEVAARGELESWLQSPTGALALCLLLDQFPRNAFRGTPRMYATDALARKMARLAIQTGHHRAFAPELAAFFSLPFGHSENLEDQDLSVEFARHLGEPHAAHAEGHRAIVHRFGRFPHRNAILGRPTTAEERRYLDDGGFSG